MKKKNLEVILKLGAGVATLQEPESIIMKKLLFLCLLPAIISCSKENIEPTAVTVPVIPTLPCSPITLYSTASYNVSIKLNWSAPQFTLPDNAHVTALIGIIHSSDTVLWSPGQLATTGLENVAEEGKITVMNDELDAILLKGKALSKFIFPAFAVTGRMDTVMNFNSSFTKVSFASMIAPSPDWFMGVHDVSLFENNNWVNSKTLDLLLYDAGTEDGDIFGYDNPATQPQQPVALLTGANATVLANGNATLAPIGTITFTKR